MTPDDLVEKVARAMERMESHAYEYCLTYKWEDYARYAVALALKEAAKVFDEAWGGMTPDEVAFAIRAMIKEEK